MSYSMLHLSKCSHLIQNNNLLNVLWIYCLFVAFSELSKVILTSDSVVICLYMVTQRTHLDVV